MMIAFRQVPFVVFMTFVTSGAFFLGNIAPENIKISSVLFVSFVAYCVMMILANSYVTWINKDDNRN